MRLALMSGAYKNAGDFLIEKRCSQIITHLFPDCIIETYKRCDIEEQFEKIHKTDVIVFCGGPLYLREPSANVPMERLLDRIEKPMMIIGGGWFGKDNSSQLPYNYHFSEFGKAFFNQIDNQGFGLSCRDYPTYKVLKNEGFKNVFLTGCPAWYNLEFLDKTDIVNSQKEIKKICISDPAQRMNCESAVLITDLLKRRYPEAQITFVFHRGIEADKYTGEKEAAEHRKMVRALEALEITIADISYNMDGFSIYDNIDLHLGFRVHAHIYCLSRRQRTVLIEEDGRGAGVDETLGLPSLIAYNDQLYTNNRYVLKGMSMLGKRTNPNLVREIENYLNLLQDTDDLYLKNAFSAMKSYYLNMTKYINQLTCL